MNFTEVAKALNAEDRETLLGLLALGDALAEELKPRLEALSRFKTRLDIEAVEQMQAAGMDQGQAVMLRASSNMAFSQMFNK